MMSPTLQPYAGFVCGVRLTVTSPCWILVLSRALLTSGIFSLRKLSILTFFCNKHLCLQHSFDLLSDRQCELEY
jgi:hypothetical protein